MSFVIETLIHFIFVCFILIFFLERKKITFVYMCSMGGPTPIESLLLPQYQMIMLRPTECLRYLFGFSVDMIDSFYFVFFSPS